MQYKLWPVPVVHGTSLLGISQKRVQILMADSEATTRRVNDYDVLYEKEAQHYLSDRLGKLP